MFYFHDPLMNTTPPPVTPPAMSRVVEATPLPVVMLPKGWQWAKSKAGSTVAPGTVARDSVAGSDKDTGKKVALPSPPTRTPLPAPFVSVSPCAAVPANTQTSVAMRAWQPPKGYVEWTTSCECRQTIKVQPHVVVAPTPLPTWSIVSWKHLAPRRLTGTKKEVIALVENDLAAAGIHHLDVQVYSAIHVIVALKR
ncbi:hypothetical protein BBC27_12125 [Acidithiobacillus ferrivorans]|uniref:Uncharacterized protein n=1 Tax=Acidithiobacillus ferrivorans TaxID=160808 RepID=A0A1B9BYE2_9PROT|nr:hypothetical protein [Acidithiobacillus ferrivorans]OCB02663.1 hypothetical protein BBC27_12125 [Acidithiobacillus ferrivorans]